MTHHRRLFGFLACLLIVSSATAVWGQAPSAAKLYEQGVNAYFAGQSSQAEQFLSEAIQWNPQDPRAYYFRALSLLRQGRTDEARGDMQVGASMEMQTPRRFAVGSALERIQGGSRLMLEQYRRSARHDAVVQASATAAATPLPVMTPPPSTFTSPDADAGVLRERRVVPLDELLRPGEPKAVVVPEAAAMPVPPPASSAAPSVAPPQPAKASPSPATPATPATTPAKNPFEDDAMKAAAEPPAAAPAAAPLTPPQPAPSQPAPASQPPAKAPTETEDNPFGT